jgi:transcriptional regulator with XRE-family HTH domain
MAEKSEQIEENLVKKTCRELGITQKELAEKIGISTTSVSKWNNGSKIPLYSQKTLELIIEHENLKMEYELFRKNMLRRQI